MGKINITKTKIFYYFILPYDRYEGFWRLGELLTLKATLVVNVYGIRTQRACNIKKTSYEHGFSAMTSWRPFDVVWLPKYIPVNCYVGIIVDIITINWHIRILPGKYNVGNGSSDLTLLTLKASIKNCSRRQFNFLLLSFKENKAWFFPWILCLAEDSLEISSLIISEKQWKIFMNAVCCSRDWRF